MGKDNISGDNVPSALPAPAVLIENLLFQWPDDANPLLDIPYFSVPNGEHIFIAGSSGTGKSTLLSLIAGILVPQQGSIALNGFSLQNLSGVERDLFRGDHIGFIFQQFNLIPYLSVIENVLLPLRLSTLRNERCQGKGKSIREQACELLLSLQLDEMLWTRPVHALSVGQQQRVACARALLGQPELLIADEPTSALDEDRRQIFLELLLRECKRVNTTILFVSHDRSLAKFFTQCIDLKNINLAYKDVEH
ncbi:MAG: ABC transporter ATP-binding protein [Desulfovibrionaceae bacterium]|nr:ABC transporter ATP-binding protein [Desulfovibrionaceae bacterium]